MTVGQPAYFVRGSVRGFSDPQPVDAPKWVDSKAFDIAGKCVPPVGIDPKNMTADQVNVSDHQLRRRLQLLLETRFQLSLRQTTKDLLIFELALGRSLSKLHESGQSGTEEQLKRGVAARQGHIEMHDEPIDFLARALSRYAGRIVVDYNDVNKSAGS